MYLYELLCGSEIYIERLKLPEKIGDKLQSLKSPKMLSLNLATDSLSFVFLSDHKFYFTYTHLSKIV